jgi:hypothetical protein
MEKIIETFLTEENRDLLNPEVAEDWKTRITELGLKGQQDMIKVTPSEDPIPYLLMKDQTRAIMEVFCPNKINIEDYDQDPIPVEVLEIYKVCKEKNYFTEIEVWHDFEKPDPLMVGKVKMGSYNFRYYLIARWGAERIDWEKVYDEAFKRLLKERKEYLQEKFETIKNNLAGVETLVRRKLKGTWVNWD